MTCQQQRRQWQHGQEARLGHDGGGDGGGGGGGETYGVLYIFFLSAVKDEQNVEKPITKQVPNTASSFTTHSRKSCRILQAFFGISYILAISETPK